MNMSPQEQAMLEYLMGMGSMNPEREAIARKQAQMAELRKSSQAPQGGYTEGTASSPGIGSLPSIYVAPHPLQNIASIAGQGLAGYGQAQGNQQANALSQQSVDKFAEFVKRMRAQQGGSNTPYTPQDPSVY
jgi:hypothetical protein